MFKLPAKQITAFKEFFAQFAKHKFYFGIATMVSNDALVENAKQKGIYLLTQQGDKLAYLNDQVTVY